MRHQNAWVKTFLNFEYKKNYLFLTKMLFLDAWREEKTIHTEIIFSSSREVMMVFGAGAGLVCVERHELETAQNQSPYAYNSSYYFTYINDRHHFRTI